MKTQNKVDLSTLASYTHMKIALDGKVITNILFFFNTSYNKTDKINNSCKLA